MQSCRQLTVPCTGCGVTSALIDTPSSACLPESQVSMTYHVTLEGSCPFLCSSCMCGIMYHNLSGLHNNQCITKIHHRRKVGDNCFSTVLYNIIWRHYYFHGVTISLAPSARRAINLSLRHKILCNTLQCRHEHHCIGFSLHPPLYPGAHDRLKD